MSLEFEETIQAVCTNANVRRELHGEESVRAIDLTFCLAGENTLLDKIESGLREHHYFNKLLVAGQQPLPDVLIPLPNLRFPQLPLTYQYTLPGKKVRGYRFIWDWGTDEAHVDFTDAVLTSIHYEIAEGGSVKLWWTVQYNGEELQDNDLYGELAGMAALGEVYLKLLAPAQLVAVTRGYRAGKPDTAQPKKDGAQQDLVETGDEGAGDGDGSDDTGSDDNDLDPNSVEAAFSRSGPAEGSQP